MDPVADGLPSGLRTFLNASQISFSVADLNLPGEPLIAVNEAFTRLTGYEANEAVGRNCRFLQPPGPASPVRQRMRDFLAREDRVEGKFVLANRRKDETSFINLVYLAKLHVSPRARLVLGTQFEVPLHNTGTVDAYDRALSEDLKSLGSIVRREGWPFESIYDALATSSALIARHRAGADLHG